MARHVSAGPFARHLGFAVPIVAALLSLVWHATTASAQTRAKPAKTCSALVDDKFIDVPAPAGAPNRYAIIITNQDYKAPFERLATPHEGGVALCKSLSQAGFRVRHIKDATLDDMKDELRRYSLWLEELGNAGPNSASFIYFSGHGAASRLDGPSYLIPTGVSIPYRENLMGEALNLPKLIADVQEAGQDRGIRNNFVVFDACRNVELPHAPAAVQTVATKGFTPVGQYTSVLVSYATAQNETAPDAQDFAQALAELLLEAGTESVNVFSRLGARLRDRTHPGFPPQKPYMQLGPHHDFYFRPTAQTPVASTPPQTLPWRVNGIEVIRDCRECPTMAEVQTADNSAVKPFLAGTHEVTFDEWQRCVRDGACGGKKPSDSGFGRGRNPVINITWADAQAYIKWLNGRQSKHTYRLLTDAEWTLASGASEASPYPIGPEGDVLCEHAHGQLSTRGSSGGVCSTPPRGPRSVGSLKPNRYGLYDMAGNVWEFVDGCHGGGAAATNCDRTLRGGSWRSSERNMTYSTSRRVPDGYSSNAAGFRIARTK